MSPESFTTKLGSSTGVVGGHSTAQCDLKATAVVFPTTYRWMEVSVVHHNVIFHVKKQNHANNSELYFTRDLDAFKATVHVC
jgi:hypothetical protein